MRILVVNAGSSSLKLRLIGPGDEMLAEHDLDTPQARVDVDELDAIAPPVSSPATSGRAPRLPRCATGARSTPR